MVVYLCGVGCVLVTVMCSWGVCVVVYTVLTFCRLLEAQTFSVVFPLMHWYYVGGCTITYTAGIVLRVNQAPTLRRRSTFLRGIVVANIQQRETSARLTTQNSARANAAHREERNHNRIPQEKSNNPYAVPPIYLIARLVFELLY
jgi:hypothetical protein